MRPQETTGCSRKRSCRGSCRGPPRHGLPAILGKPNSAFRCFRQGATRCVFERLAGLLSQEPDSGHARIDATVVSVHPKTSGARAMIPPQADRKELRTNDGDMYDWRHPVENVCDRAKEFSGIAAHSEKTGIRLQDTPAPRRPLIALHSLSTDPGRMENSMRVPGRDRRLASDLTSADRPSAHDPCSGFPSGRRGTRIARIQAFSFRFPIHRPVETSFGTMTDRPAVFVRVEDDEGAFGWGEVFANWPAAGAEHRVRLLELDMAPLVLGREVERPDGLFSYLTARTHVRALQCGEYGPFRQVIAGLDVALWDLFARRAELPLRKFIRPGAPDHVPAYASGIDIRDAERPMGASRAAGFSTYKVKVGFDPETDAQAILDLGAVLGENEYLCADANQAWNREAALAFLEATEPARLLWVEEPIAADAPEEEWTALAVSPTPLAGGENIAGFEAFDQAIAAGALAVIQPDLAKWGGITGCLEVARRATTGGRRYCPHFLGGGIGLAASAELLAAVGGDGLLEVDVNTNPLRDAFSAPGPPIANGKWPCSGMPGLGIVELPEEIRAHRTLQIDLDVN